MAIVNLILHAWFTNYKSNAWFTNYKSNTWFTNYKILKYREIGIYVSIFPFVFSQKDVAMNVQGFKGREKPSVGKSFICIDLLKPRHKA